MKKITSGWVIIIFDGLYHPECGPLEIWFLCLLWNLSIKTSIGNKSNGPLRQVLSNAAIFDTSLTVKSSMCYGPIVLR